MQLNWAKDVIHHLQVTKLPSTHPVTSNIGLLPQNFEYWFVFTDSGFNSYNKWGVRVWNLWHSILLLFERNIYYIPPMVNLLLENLDSWNCICLLYLLVYLLVKLALLLSVSTAAVEICFLRGNEVCKEQVVQRNERLVIEWSLGY